MKGIKELLGDAWHSQLKDYLETKEFKSIPKKINRDRKYYTVIPEKNSELFFKAFRTTPYEDVKVVLLSQDPYSNPPEAFDGLAFSNSNLLRPQPSLSNILKEVEDDIYNGFNIERAANLSLYPWAEQGVLLINVAHSVIQKRPESHLKYWLNFTLKVLEVLNNKNDIVFLLFGKKAQQYEKYLSNPSHHIIKTSHPSPLAANKAAPVPFLGSRCFSECNEALSVRNKKEIIF